MLKNIKFGDTDKTIRTIKQFPTQHNTTQHNTTQHNTTQHKKNSEEISPSKEIRYILE